MVGLATPADVPFRLVTLPVGHHTPSVLKGHRGTLGLTRDFRAPAQGSPALAPGSALKELSPAHEDPELPSESGRRPHVTKGHTGTGAPARRLGGQSCCPLHMHCSPRPGSAASAPGPCLPLRGGSCRSWPGSGEASVPPRLSGPLSTSSPLPLRTETGSARQGSLLGQGGGGLGAQVYLLKWGQGGDCHRGQNRTVVVDGACPSPLHRGSQAVCKNTHQHPHSHPSYVWEGEGRWAPPVPVE